LIEYMSIVVFLVCICC